MFFHILIYPSNIMKNVAVRIPEHGDPKTLQNLSALPIILLLLGMSITINFNGQHKFSTVKINDKILNGLLTVKLVPKGANLQEFVPQFFLGGGWIFSVFACFGG